MRGYLDDGSVVYLTSNTRGKPLDQQDQQGGMKYNSSSFAKIHQGVFDFCDKIRHNERIA
ncbi:hypothetical protein GGGNBK_09830 [Sporosarcina sp. ANT_H38]